MHWTHENFSIFCAECNSKSKGQDVEKAGKELAMKADKLSSYKNYNGAANVAASAADKYNLAALCFASTGDCKEATSAAALAKSAAQKSADIAKSSPNRGLTYAAERAMKAADAAQKSANSCK